MDKRDELKIQRFKNANSETNRAIAFDFFDKNGFPVTKTNLPCVRIEVLLMDGQLFTFTNDEFESFNGYKFHVGFDKQDVH